MAHLITGALGIIEVGTNVAGLPFVAGAAMLLKEIVEACDEMRIHKKKAKHIKNQCVQFSLVLEEQNRDLDSQLVESIDEMQAVLERIHNRMSKWSRLSAWSLILKRSEIDQGLQECDSNLQAALQRFHITAQAVVNRTQRNADQEAKARHEELKAMLIQAITAPSERQEIIAMQRTGSRVAEELMQAGQEQLQEGLLYNPIQCESPDRETPVPDQGLQDALFKFHMETGTLPTIKVLNAEISKVEDAAVAGGTYSDIWLGLWLGRKKVALKGLRNIKADHPEAKKRIEREVKTWSSLKNEHILPFYGIVTNLGNHIHMVSPWQENGNVLKFLKNNPEADRRRLIRGAAQGLAYLHSKMIVHGNVKCTNILVLDNGEACICDFGMSKLIEEVTEKSASATLTAAGSARWLAPELIDGTTSSPTFATDTYSFAMAILELVTGKYPFAERKRDASVIHDVVVRKVTPAHPKGCPALSEGLWQLLTTCWHNTPAMRPSMSNVVSDLELL